MITKAAIRERDIRGMTRAGFTLPYATKRLWFERQWLRMPYHLRRRILADKRVFSSWVGLENGILIALWTTSKRRRLYQKGLDRVTT